MTKELNEFLSEIGRARSVADMAASLDKLTTKAIDTSDQYRFSIVHAVSAFDRYIHAVVYRGLVSAAEGRIPESKRFPAFRVSVKAAMLAAQGRPIEEWFGQEIAQQHAFLSFQRSNKVADALRLVMDKVVWREVGNILGEDPEALKKDLDLVVDRRNKIVHEADFDLILGQRWAIDHQSCVHAISLIQRVGNAIDRILP